jgi:hypothetical protein
MLNIDRALGDDRLIKAIIELSASEFNKLIERFREELTDDAKAWNRIVSCFRVLVEHAIGGV